MTNILEKLAISLTALITLLGVYLFGINNQINKNKEVFGGAPPGIAASIASSSQVVVGMSNIQQLWTASTTAGCLSRVISTVGKPIMLSFGDRNVKGGNNSTTTVSGITGHYQAASTTVTYDAGLYGCGPVAAYGFDASSTITISEFR